MLLYQGNEDKVNEIIEEFVERPGEEIRTKDKLRKVVEKYKAEKIPPPWEKTIEIEKELFFNAGPYRFVVIPDMVIQWRGAIYGVDHKHTTKMDDNFFRKFTRDSQIDAQMIAIKEKYGSCNGIWVNGVVVRKGGPKAKLPEIEFLRDVAERTADELDQSRKYFEDWARQCSEDKQKLERRTNCFSFRRSCPYLGICTDRYSNEEIQEYFEVVPWKPRVEEEEED